MLLRHVDKHARLDTSVPLDHQSNSSVHLVTIVVQVQHFQLHAYPEHINQTGSRHHLLHVQVYQLATIVTLIQLSQSSAQPDTTAAQQVARLRLQCLLKSALTAHTQAQRQ